MGVRKQVEGQLAQLRFGGRDYTQPGWVEGIYIYRVFFSEGPTQKSSKYGIGPSQQDKITKYAGHTKSYQRSKE